MCIMNFSEKVMKQNIWPFKVWFGFLLFMKILLKSAQLLSKHFSSGLFLCILYFFSFFFLHKSKDTTAIPQPSVQHLVYVFPIFFCFHIYFNSFLLSKNILLMFLYSITSMSQRSCQFLFEVK